MFLIYMFLILLLCISSHHSQLTGNIEYFSVKKSSTKSVKNPNWVKMMRVITAPDAFVIDFDNLI